MSDPARFIRERQYLRGVTQKTLDWYAQSFRAFDGAIDSRTAIETRVTSLRQRGVSAISVNTYLRCINAYLRWLHTEHGQPLVHIPRLKEEQKILATLKPEQVQSILRWKPTTFSDSKLYSLCALLLDSGVRISEALALSRADIDLDNLVLRVRGKGQKHRLVPMSLEMRRVLFRWLAKHQFELVFPTRQGTKQHPRNVLRAFRSLAKNLAITGVRFSPHTFRHTFAVSYLRAGGNVLYLQRILGHSSLEMTNRYLRSLGVEDLQAVHNRFSLLSR